MKFVTNDTKHDYVYENSTLLTVILVKIEQISICSF